MGRRPAGDAIDVHIGKRVRQRRVQLSLSQKELAESLGISFQQLQKNERGTNRIGASRLHEICHALDVPVSFFFDDLPPQPPLKRPRTRIEVEDELPPEIMNKKEIRELIEGYYKISDAVARRQFLRFLRSLADR